jgi:hypothetical protein
VPFDGWKVIMLSSLSSSKSNCFRGFTAETVIVNFTLDILHSGLVSVSVSE